MSAIQSSVSAPASSNSALDTLKSGQSPVHAKAVEKTAANLERPSTIGPLGILVLLSGICIAVGGTLWAIPLRAHGILQAGRSRPRYESGATGIGKLENGSRPEAISEIARLRRSLPEPDPENRAAISIRSARPPIITVIGASPVSPGWPPLQGLLNAVDRAHPWVGVVLESQSEILEKIFWA